MENGASTRRLWPVAVTVSALVHGAVLFGFSLVSSPPASEAQTAACRELHESLQRLPATARFQIIIYSSQAHFLLQRSRDFLEATPNVVREVGDALEALAAKTPEGRTEHGPALRKAFLLRPD